MPQPSTARTATTSPCPSDPCHCPSGLVLLAPPASYFFSTSCFISTAPFWSARSVGVLRRPAPSVESVGLLYLVEVIPTFPKASCLTSTPPHQSACSGGRLRWLSRMCPSTMCSSVVSAVMLHLGIPAAYLSSTVEISTFSPSTFFCIPTPPHRSACSVGHPRRSALL